MFFPQKTPWALLLRFLKNGCGAFAQNEATNQAVSAVSQTQAYQGPRCLCLTAALVWAGLLFIAPFASLQAAPPTPQSAPSSKPSAAVASEARAAEQTGKKDDLESPEKIYQKALQAFATERFENCVELLKKLIAQGVQGPEAESVYYTLAAAYYNSRDFQNSKTAFEGYLKRYPSGAKASDCKISLSHCLAQLGDKEAALGIFKSLNEEQKNLSDSVLLSWASLLKETGNLQSALALLRPRGEAPPQNEESVQLLFLLASTEAEAGNPDGAFRYLQMIHRRPDLVPSPLQLNAISLSLGDNFLSKSAFRLALRAYAYVRRKDEIIAAQKSRLQGLQTRYQANLKLLEEYPARIAEIQESNARLKVRFEEGQKVLAQVEGTDDYLPSLRLRQARASQELARYWDAIVLLESLLPTSKNSSIREDVLFGLSLSHAQLNQSAESDLFSTAYLQEYRNGKNAETLSFMRANLKMQREDYAGAEILFQKALLDYPDGSRRKQTLFLLGNARFSMGKYPEARETYKQYLGLYPDSELGQEIEYRTALCLFFKGEIESALGSLRAFMLKYPEGPYSADSSYRIALSHMSMQQYQQVLTQCEAWRYTFGKHAQLAEVLALKGDAYAALRQPAEAATAYLEAMASSPSEEVLNYALFEANKQYQALGRWDKIATLFQEFIQEHPQHPGVVSAMYWLSRAMQKNGRIGEAKEFLAAQIATYVSDRRSEALEQLISQLAQLCAKPPPGYSNLAAAEQSKKDATAPTAGTAKPPAEPVRTYAPEAELIKLFPEDSDANNTLRRARLLFAKSELLRLTRKTADASALLGKICAEIAPAELSASLLAKCGDHELSRGNIENAQTFYNELLRAFPKSTMLDAAYNGMGQIALQEARPEDALRWFDEAIEKLGAPTTQPRVTLGKAKALLALKKWEQARALFQQLATTREWRGEATAEAVYSLGEIHFQNAEYETGLQYFQRVFVAYQRYPEQVSRSYLRAADCFERIGDKAKAQSHLRELLANERLSTLPAAAEGKRRLTALSEK